MTKEREKQFDEVVEAYADHVDLHVRCDLKCPTALLFRKYLMELDAKLHKD